ncbi:MAG: hypothetical protein GY880_31615 [Planctomycetaceae bacterium]|nr:hypothetical protein [Planctomycetaceae bacterium]
MVDRYAGALYDSSEWGRVSVSWAEYPIDSVPDFPIVLGEQRPADKTPPECTPTRDEIKRLPYQG